MKTKKLSIMHRTNKSVMIAYSIIAFALLFSYLLEFVKGARTLTYTLIFETVNLVPYIMCLVAYKRNNEATGIKYIMTSGFSILYAYVLLTAKVPVTFVYVFLIFFIIIPYGDMVLCYISGGIAIVANIISVAVGFASGSLTTDDMATVEIQMAAVVLAAVFTGVATYTINKVNQHRMGDLNAEKEKIDAMLTRTLDISKGISDDIDSVTDRMKHFEESVGITRDSMQDVASGANETAEAMQEQLTQTQAVVEQMDKAKKVSDTIADSMEETKASVEQGKENIEQLLECVRKSETAGTMVSTRMQELFENTEQMHTIVEMINSVTRQTALLSLNASIEAARAGEAGRGFAVVADEISDLAKQTSDATVSITDLIGQITVSINEVVGAVQELMDSNREQNHSAEIMADNFEKIETCSKSIVEVSEALEGVVSSLGLLNEEMVENINTVSAVTEEVSARAYQTLEGSEQDTVVVGEITNVIVEINEKAKKLNA